MGLAALFPIPFALWYDEPFWPFLVAGAITSGLGFALERLTAGAAGRVGVREGFLVVALTWLLAAAFASIPYLFEGGEQLSSPLDAYFEGMSGFTTTGASVVTDFDEINRSLGIWRQFSQWLGGMGIIVLAIAVLPRLRVGGRQLMESELPGLEVAQLSEHIRSTARKLWVFYVGLTALLALLLATLGWVGVDDAMTPYEALAHALSTMPTGGFSTQPDSVTGFSATTQWILVLFMLIAGANFALLYRAFVRRRPHVLARDEELRLYIALVLIAAASLTVMLWGYGIAEGEEAVRTGTFQVVSIITTTGLRSADFAMWPRAAHARALRAHVCRGLGGIGRRIDQGGAPPAARKVPPARGRSDAESRVRDAHPAQWLAGRRTHRPGNRGVHPALRRVLGRRGIGDRHRLRDHGRRSRDARLPGDIRDCAWERRSRVRCHGTLWLVRAAR